MLFKVVIWWWFVNIKNDTDFRNTPKSVFGVSVLTNKIKWLQEKAEIVFGNFIIILKFCVNVWRLGNYNLEHQNIIEVYFITLSEEGLSKQLTVN